MKIGYRNIQELREVPTFKAKEIYSSAYSMLAAQNKKVSFIHLLTGLGGGLGAYIGILLTPFISQSLGLTSGYEAHVGAVFAGIGAYIGGHFAQKRINKIIKPYLEKVLNETPA